MLKFYLIVAIYMELLFIIFIAVILCSKYTRFCAFCVEMSYRAKPLQADLFHHYIAGMTYMCLILVSHVLGDELV